MASPEGNAGTWYMRIAETRLVERKSLCRARGYGSRPRKASSMQKTPMKLSITLILIMWLRNIQPRIKQATPRNV